MPMLVYQPPHLVIAANKNQVVAQSAMHEIGGTGPEHVGIQVAPVAHPHFQPSARRGQVTPAPRQAEFTLAGPGRQRRERQLAVVVEADRAAAATTAMGMGVFNHRARFSQIGSGAKSP